MADPDHTPTDRSANIAPEKMARSIEPIARTSRGLVDALFDTIDRLNSKQIDAEQARAISHTARTIVTVASLELEFRKWSENDATAVPLKSLQLDIEGKTTDHEPAAGEPPPAA